MLDYACLEALTRILENDTEKKTQADHAKRRVLERYGVEFTDREYKEICNVIKNGGGETLLVQSRTRNIKYVFYKEKDFYVVYDKTRNQIATFLTKEMIKETFGNGVLECLN